MYYGELTFNTVPTIGFAHHLYAEKQQTTVYGRHHKGFEIVYISNGELELNYNEQTLTASTGSIVVLFRELPITLFGSAEQSHCTVQAEMPLQFTLLDNGEIPQPNSLYLPFVIPPCPENERIKKMLYTIVSDLGVSREDNGFHAALQFMEILRLLDKHARTLYCELDNASLISYRVKQLISQQFDKTLTLADIAADLNKTPNYINRLFREANGITIHQYINREKAARIAELIRHRQIPFKTACDSVGIFDTAFGYRLFKKHIGITPKQFLNSKVYHN